MAKFVVDHNNIIHQYCRELYDHYITDSADIASSLFDPTTEECLPRGVDEFNINEVAQQNQFNILNSQYEACDSQCTTEYSNLIILRKCDESYMNEGDVKLYRNIFNCSI